MSGLKPIKVKKSSIKNRKNPNKKETENNTSSSEKLHYIIICILFILSLVFIYKIKTLNDKIDKLNDKVENGDKIIKNQKETNDELNDFYLKNLSKVDFIDKNIVFVIKGFGDYYYSYDCMMKKVGDNQFSYWAYNKEQAIKKGYEEGRC